MLFFKETKRCNWNEKSQDQVMQYNIKYFNTMQFQKCMKF